MNTKTKMTDQEKIKMLREALEDVVGAKTKTDLEMMRTVLNAVAGDNARSALVCVNALIATMDDA